jgi:hypothetical protein
LRAASVRKLELIIADIRKQERVLFAGGAGLLERFGQARQATSSSD